MLSEDGVEALPDPWSREERIRHLIDTLRPPNEVENVAEGRVEALPDPWSKKSGVDSFTTAIYLKRYSDTVSIEHGVEALPDPWRRGENIEYLCGRQNSQVRFEFVLTRAWSRGGVRILEHARTYCKSLWSEQILGEIRI